MRRTRSWMGVVVFGTAGAVWAAAAGPLSSGQVVAVNRTLEAVGARLAAAGSAIGLIVAPRASLTYDVTVNALPPGTVVHASTESTAYAVDAAGLSADHDAGGVTRALAVDPTLGSVNLDLTSSTGSPTPNAPISDFRSSWQLVPPGARHAELTRVLVADLDAGGAEDVSGSETSALRYHQWHWNNAHGTRTFTVDATGPEVRSVASTEVGDDGAVSQSGRSSLAGNDGGGATQHRWSWTHDGDVRTFTSTQSGPDHTQGVTLDLSADGSAQRVALTRTGTAGTVETELTTSSDGTATLTRSGAEGTLQVYVDDGGIVIVTDGFGRTVEIGADGTISTSTH